MKNILLILASFLFTLSLQAEVKPLKIIHIGGGCCHDYENQKNILKEGIESRINAAVDLFVSGTEKDHRNPIFDKENWSQGYDAVLFNVCYGAIVDDEYIKKIVAETAKNGKGVSFIHCSLHTFRNAKSGAVAWRELIGLSSKDHGKKSPILVENTKKEHPIMIGFPEMWETPNGELYNIFAKGAHAEVLGEGRYPDSDKTNACIWINKYQDSKVFGTSLGHHNETMQAKEYQDLLSRGILWTVGKLKDDGTPVAGYGK
jgi:uncharacterized protein